MWRAVVLPFVVLMQLCQPSRDLLSRSMTISCVFWNGTSQDMRVSESAIGSGMCFFNTEPVLSQFSGLWQSWRGWSFCCLPIARLLFYNIDTVARLKIKPFPLPFREKRHNISFQPSWGSHCTSNHLLIKCIWKDSDCQNVTVVLHSLLSNQSSYSLGREELVFSHCDTFSESVTMSWSCEEHLTAQVREDRQKNAFQPHFLWECCVCW